MRVERVEGREGRKKVTYLEALFEVRSESRMTRPRNDEVKTAEHPVQKEVKL